jgi:hypothetical protein
MECPIELSSFYFPDWHLLKEFLLIIIYLGFSELMPPIFDFVYDLVIIFSHIYDTGPTLRGS